jgi:hypothetical protein
MRTYVDLSDNNKRLSCPLLKAKRKCKVIGDIRVHYNQSKEMRDFDSSM